MVRLYLDHLSLVDLTASEFVRVAAELGCAGVGLYISPVSMGPALDLTTDHAARRELIDAIQASRLAVGIIEPCLLREDPDWPLLERTVALAAELGGGVNCIGFDPEVSRLHDSIGRLAVMAASANIPVTVESFTLSTLRTPADALTAARAAGGNVRLTFDALHVMRSGCGWADVAALPPEMIAHVQLNDGPIVAPEDRFDEAVHGRLPPGQGEFDLAGLLAVLPPTARIAIEAPFRAPAGLSPLERGRILLESTARLFATELN
ncbi:sugar phosphate isomerase/epimerase family protein [Novosphingobium sp. Chol11]|uniref:sugar phosphate isomerase/epimerase family protein n=1 Tax=Novosphingobium sp. Chol11 TaxID=1385763 RepID=UPI000BE30DC8|nr:TIM barrel protein [Novosphingobium sp. Chol11]